MNPYGQQQEKENTETTYYVRTAWQESSTQTIVDLPGVYVFGCPNSL